MDCVKSPWCEVGGSGYKDLERRNEQELWFFNRMKLRLSTEVLDKSYTQAEEKRSSAVASDKSPHPMVVERLREQEASHEQRSNKGTGKDGQQRPLSRSVFLVRC